ncbi:MAG: hypothetical protein GXO33_02160 [Epsilonproteobacteria bacterium]|nr:hypothetical protein [Campylobacterota bacterium]
MARFQTILTLWTVLAVTHAAAAIEARYADSGKCKPCHKTITEDWERSLHAKSHFSKNELYAKMLEYTARKRHKSVASQEIRCAQCHNPHVSDAVNEEEKFAAAFGLDSEEVKKSMNSRFIKDGVNCIVCHNIKKIHRSKKAGKRGKDTVEWGPNDTMVGPFKDARSPYHKTAYAPFFKKDPNKLCFVCHYNERSVYGTIIGSTGPEYEKSGSKKACVECHMGPEVKGHSVQVALQNSTAGKSRTLRHHLFAGVRNSDIVADAIEMDYKQVGRKITVSVRNLVPHKLPTSFGGRMMRVTAVYKDASGKILGEKSYDITARYIDEKGRDTVPYLAKRVAFDNRLKPGETRKVVFRAPKGSKTVDVTLRYYLLSPEWVEKLHIEDPAVKKAYKIASLHIGL